MDTINTPSELLSQLRIDRDTVSNGRQHHSLPIVGVLIIAILLAVTGLAVAFYNLDPDAEADVVTQLDQTAIVASMPADEVLGGSDRPSVLDATGYVVARRSATVSAPVTGRVAQLFVEEGMTVQTGQTLAQLDDRFESSQLALAQAQVSAAHALAAELDAGIVRVQRDLARWRALTDRGMASQAQVDALTAEANTLLARQQHAGMQVRVAKRRLALRRIQLADLTIRAPFNGVVIHKSAQAGEMISPISAGGTFTRTGICTIVDMDSLEVEVEVNEAYINRVSSGQAVQIQLNAYPDTVYPGAVLAVIPAADRSKATIRVRIEFQQLDAQVLPDMGLKVAFLPQTQVRS